MQARKIRSYACLAAGLLILAGSQFVPGDEPAEKNPPPVDGEGLKPKWQVGQQWVVETVSQLVQGASTQDAKVRSSPLQWQFAVQKQEPVAGQDCYRVEVRCLLEGRQQPVTYLWVDQKSLALRQVQTQLPVQGKFRTVTESYQFSDGQPAPVLGPLSAIPLDMPLFLPGRTKGLSKFTYEAIQGPGGKKALGDLGFSVEIEQRISAAPPAEVKALLANDFMKDVKIKPVYEVRLKTPLQRVRQLWQADQPWPVVSDNGVTQARLIKVIPPKAASSK